VLVTKLNKKRNLAAIVFLWVAFLGFTSQNGQAIGAENGPTATHNHNSPGHLLRGIEFTSPALLEPSDPDAYGYVWDTVLLSWIDPSGATSVTLNSSGFAGPINIGFSFPFYENTYTQVYVSSNGFVSFGEGSGSIANTGIPNEFSPNNFIAPFWSDLELGDSGVISTMQDSDVNGPYFVVNYVGVSKNQSPTDLLTFQVILYDNGDIRFQYQTLTGDLNSTIGLEDGDGVIGLPYLPGLVSGLAAQFQRPVPSAHVKVLPVYQSGLTQSGTRDFLLDIRNTGELGADTFNLTSAFGGIGNPGNSDWLVTLWEEDGSTPLTNTGILNSGQTRTILVRLESPTSAPTGDYTSFNVTAASTLDPGKTSTALFQAAIPAGHFIGFGNVAGLDLVRINATQQKVFDVTESGRFNPVVILARNNYFYAWQTFQNIEYAVLTYGGHPIQPTTKLTDNASAILSTFDFSPSLTVAPNGDVGITWVRRVFDPLRGNNYNVYFAILNPNGNILVAPFDITNNGPCDADPEICWQDGDNEDVPVFTSPTILATSDNHFVIAWIDERILPGGDVTDIDYTVYDSDGGLIVPAGDLKNGNAGSNLYDEPRLVELPNQRVLITYSDYNPTPGSEGYIPAFGVFSIGSAIKGEQLFVGTNGINPDSVLLTNSKILVAWTNTVTNQIECGILTDDGTSVSFNNQFIQFQNPDLRKANFVSTMATTDGLGVLSWVDAEGGGGNRLYYAMVNSNGVVVTPPMFSWVDLQAILVSSNGQGIAPIPDWRLFMPLLRKN